MTRPTTGSCWDVHIYTVKIPPTLDTLYTMAGVIVALHEWSKFDVKTKILATLRPTQPAACRSGWRRKTTFVLEWGERMAAMHGQVQAVGCQW